MNKLRKLVSLVCSKCKRVYEFNPRLFRCPKCGTVLDVHTSNLEWPRRSKGRGVWRYSSLLPIPCSSKPISLGEGGTPLTRLENIEFLLVKLCRCKPRVYAKLELLNPTGSFKDRGMTVAVTLAKSLGYRVFVVASTGNTASSAAAYTAKAGSKLLVIVPKGAVARGKLIQVIAYGATLIEFDGLFDQAIRVAERVISMYNHVYPLNSFNPWRLEGQKTLAYEVVDDIGAPSFVIVPVGNGGNIYAIWSGFKIAHELDVIKDLPVMVGVQAETSAPIALTWYMGLDKLYEVHDPRTIASAIRIGRPVNWFKALKAVEESNGLFVTVNDQEILDALKILARLEGLLVEPASATTLAALLRLCCEGLIDSGDDVVLVLTGHGLKDPGVLATLETNVFKASSFEEVREVVEKL